MKSNYAKTTTYTSKKLLNPRSQKINWYKLSFVFSVIIIIIFNLSPVIAQPSGGPYGPIQQTYDLPKVTGTIYYVATDGQENQTGETLSNPTTIESAIKRVVTGDAIIMRGGTYRTGNLIFNQGITIQPYADEEPILKGTYIATEWKALRDGVWVTSWSNLFPSKPDDWWTRHRQGMRTPQYKFNNDMVFIDGKFLQAKGWEGELDENSYFIDYENQDVFIGVDPADKLVEITAFNVAILRTIKDVNGKKSDKKGPTIRGITFTQYAYRAIEIEGKYPEGLSDEANHGKDVVGTTLEHCTISYGSRVAAYIKGDSLTIRNCKISDTSTEGIYIIASNDVLLEKNIFTRNNIERITGYFAAAVKIFNQCYRVTCNDNLVIDHPYSNGIWYDVGNVDGVFTNNWVEGVGINDDEMDKAKPWPSDNGFFFEISIGAICAGNVFVNCDQGVWVLNSSDVKVYQNTFVNSTICFGRNERSAAADHFGWHPSTGPDVHERDGHVFINNLLTSDENFIRPLLSVWQPEPLNGEIKEQQLIQLDYNVYVSGSKPEANEIIWWSPIKNEKHQFLFNSLEGLQKLESEYSSHSNCYSNYKGPLFKSSILGNYQLLDAFPGAYTATDLPSKIEKLLDQTKTFSGAYSPIK